MKPALHVAYLSSVLSVHDERFLAALVGAGYRTTLITYCPDELPRAVTALGGLEVVHRRPALPARLQGPLFARHAPGFARLLRRLKPDLLHSGYVWKDGWLGALAGFHPHLVMPWGSDILLEPDRSRVVRGIVRYVIRRADMITCDCEVVADKIVQLSGYPRERIVVFPWGVDRRVFHPTVPPAPERRALGWDRNPVLIMNRSFRPLYNVGGFLEALALVRQGRPDVRVFLLGSGPEEPMLRSLARRLRLEEVVRFVGAVPAERMASWLRAADLYVSNSLSDGASLSLLEAMACGLPVVVTDVPALREWVSDGRNGLVVPRGDSAALARALLRLLEDATLRARMGRANAAIAAERADWGKNFRKLETIYQRLLGPPGGAATRGMPGP